MVSLSIPAGAWALRGEVEVFGPFGPVDGVAGLQRGVGGDDAGFVDVLPDVVGFCSRIGSVRGVRGVCGFPRFVVGAFFVGHRGEDRVDSVLVVAELAEEGAHGGFLFFFVEGEGGVGGVCVVATVIYKRAPTPSTPDCIGIFDWACPE